MLRATEEEDEDAVASAFAPVAYTDIILFLSLLETRVYVSKNLIEEEEEERKSDKEKF